MNAEKKMTKARTGLVLDHPFFGSLSLKMHLIPEPSIETAMTNGVSIKYNPTWIEGMSLDQTKGLIAHEVMHCALLHHLRRESREHRKWNIACDYAIDPILNDAGFMLPDMTHIKAEYKDMSADKIYSLIPDMDDGNENGDGDGDSDGDGDGDSDGDGDGDSNNDSNSNQNSDPGGNGGVEDAPGNDGRKVPSKEDISKQIEDWTIATEQAAQQAKAIGNLPGSLNRLIKEMLEPKVDWKQELWNFIDTNCKDDYTWLIPNRRFIQQGIILPSLHTEKLGEAICACDTSGSVSEDELKQYAAELSDILAVFDLELHVFYCDTQVHGNAEIFTREDIPLVLNAKGGGGTRFTPVFKEVEKLGLQPKFLIYFTDMWCNDFPDKHPDYPVLWLKVGKGSSTTPPFGKVVEIEID